jgi:hypothetical protein
MEDNKNVELLNQRCFSTHNAELEEKLQKTIAGTWQTFCFHISQIH